MEPAATRVRLSPSDRLDQALRCALCHDALGAAPGGECEVCRVAWHVECRAELGRCPSLGCAGWAGSAPPQVRRSGALGWLLDLELGIWGVMLSGPALAPFVFVDFLLSDAPHRSGPHDPGGALALGVLSLIGAVVVAPLAWGRLRDRLRAWRLERAGLLVPAAVEGWASRPRNAMRALRYRYRDASGQEHTGESAYHHPAWLWRRCPTRSTWVWVDPRRPDQSRWVDDP